MKTCICGHVFEEKENSCPICGRSVQEAKAEGQYAAPISSIAEPVEGSQDTPDVSPISAVFKAPEPPKEKAQRHVSKPETPQPGPNIEVKPIANASSEKFNPMKNPPPFESSFAVLGTVGTIIRVFVLLLPFIGFVYSILLSLGINRKENIRKLGVAFLTAYLLQIVLIAASMLIFALSSKTGFNDFIEIIIHTVQTFITAIKTL